ncbi:hypothetical protein GTP46_20770 [Duganella sp. FT135W]|uniref:Uncharacterized protein n=1 Tax=Duganella flavida TaxID=2692175 RepID=A0A6L8KC79_9BURK|nr:hypothetical protein [Duganella flavida]MYM25063.1 hypothetical protein [Duganella flavida]
MRALIATGLFAAAAAAQGGDHRADIDYYTHHYDGADIALSRFHCGDAGAMRNSEQRSAWLACYRRFAVNYKAALPVGRTIPSEVADAMSDAELAAAQQLMNQVFVQIAQEARQQADLVLLAQGGDVFSARSASGPLPGLPAQTRQLPDQP